MTPIAPDPSSVPQLARRRWVLTRPPGPPYTRPHARSHMVSARERRSPMNAQHADDWTRRRFLGGLTVAGAAGLLGLQPRWVGAEPPPETTTLRLMEAPALCFAPEYVAEALLLSEGFHTVQYVKTGGGAGTMKALAAGDIDLAMTTAPILAIQVDAGDPVLMLAGVHG